MDYDYDHSSSDEEDIDDLNFVTLLCRRRCQQLTTQRRTSKSGRNLSTRESVGVTSLSNENALSTREPVGATSPTNEDEERTQEGCRRHRPRVYKNRSDHFLEWDDIDFYHRFRLSKRVINYVLHLIKDHIKSPTDWNHAVTPAQQILLTIGYLASGSTVTVGDIIGVTKSTASKHTWKVLQAIARLRPHFINLKNDDETLDKKQKGFYEIAHFPKVIGVIDCTHVRVQSPGGSDAKIYCNRKGFYSMNVQAVCDSDLRFTDVVARWHGSAPNSQIFDNSKIQSKFRNGHFGDYILLGDSGYALTKYCITPIQDSAGEVEKIFNESLIKTRNPIECAFAVWKKRFPVLSLGVKLDIVKVQGLIVAAAILHNIAVGCNEIEPPPLSQAVEDALIFVNSVQIKLFSVDKNTDERNKYLRYFEKTLSAGNIELSAESILKSDR